MKNAIRSGSILWKKFIMNRVYDSELIRCTLRPFGVSFTLLLWITGKTTCSTISSRFNARTVWDTLPVLQRNLAASSVIEGLVFFRSDRKKRQFRIRSLPRRSRTWRQSSNTR